jgi:hypothetical protein
MWMLSDRERPYSCAAYMRLDDYRLPLFNIIANFTRIKIQPPQDAGSWFPFVK